MGEMDSMQMTVSPICMKDGKKVAYVEFRDQKRRAEGIIPSCKIVSGKGFSEGEIKQLEIYMEKHLEKLKKTAARLNVFEALKK